MAKLTNETTPKEEGNQKISPVELAKRKNEMLGYWKEQKHFLNEQTTYLKARNGVNEQLAIEEELELRRIVALMRLAQITGPPEQAPEEKTPNGPFIVSRRDSEEKTDMVQPEEGVPKEPVFRKLKIEKQP